MSNNCNANWLSCSFPRLMLKQLEAQGKQGLIGRELRLFACACCRHVGDLLRDERSWQAIEVAERFADGEASLEELDSARTAATMAVDAITYRIQQINLAAHDHTDGQSTPDVRLLGLDDWHPEERCRNAATAASYCAEVKTFTSNLDPMQKTRGDWRVAKAAALFAFLAAASRDTLEKMDAKFLAGSDNYLEYEDTYQSSLLRCVFRDPIQAAATRRPRVEPRIRDMAESIYQMRTFHEVPLLGKELASGGCCNEEIVVHCIESSVHTSGCWALDAIRGFPRMTQSDKRD